jgi:hypothetical protein
MQPPAPHAEADPLFVARFRSRIPPEIAASFTPGQLAAIHTAFALRTLPRHSLDLRRSIPTPWGRMYLAIVAGREKRGHARRAADRARRGAGRVADLALVGTLTSLVVVLGAGALYLMKMALGLDLLPGVDMLPDKALLQALLG